MRSLLLLILSIVVLRATAQNQSAGISIESLYGFNLDNHSGFGYTLNGNYQFRLFRNFYLRSVIQYERLIEKPMVTWWDEWFGASYGVEDPGEHKRIYSSIGIPIGLYIDFNYYLNENPKTRGYIFGGYKPSKMFLEKHIYNYEDSVSVFYSEFGYGLHNKLINSMFFGLDFATRIASKLSIEYALTYHYMFIDPKKQDAFSSVGIQVGIKYEIGGKSQKND